ncbi:hypothetical protein DPMN_159949 [Dreissena polymorpha]|uniref:Uncharacterized protein n=1 Tax=Dreissena polymorpha TaxID=45954 RepID=A0A9D4EMK4_DREPO|nr:hypothetical protein DPMN_159949 [Dreissena polymorpha]
MSHPNHTIASQTENGKAGLAVRIAKGLVKKATKSNMDLWKAILDWRNTPTEGMDRVQRDI